jgi:hypothetical protein
VGGGAPYSAEVTRSPTVDEYLAALRHPRRRQISRLRRLIIDSVPGIHESVKWNAPNFSVDGVDRVTFRLQPGDRFQLVLHRGVAIRTDQAEFSFADPTGLVEWATRDRGVLTVGDEMSAGDDLTPHEAQIIDLVRRWVLV